MKLLIITILVIISISFISARNKKLKRKRDVEVTAIGDKEIVDKRENPHSMTDDAASKSITEAYKEMSKTNANLKDEEDCIKVIVFDNKNVALEATRKLWNHLTLDLVDNNLTLDRQWLIDYARIVQEIKLISKSGESVSCGKVLEDNLLSIEEVNIKGIIVISKSAKKLIADIIGKGGDLTSSKMKKFITSSASTYRHDKMVSNKLFNTLNSGKKRRRRFRRRRSN